jgi:hypothetical protein
MCRSPWELRHPVNSRTHLQFSLQRLSQQAIFSRPSLDARNLPRILPAGSTTARAYHNFMRLLEALASAFINTFGITQPSGQMRRRAAWFIFSLLLIALCMISLAAAMIFHMLRT